MNSTVQNTMTWDGERKKGETDRQTDGDRDRDRSRERDGKRGRKREKGRENQLTDVRKSEHLS